MDNVVDASDDNLTKGKVIIMGDVHGDFGRLNPFLNKAKPSILLQCGDMGYFPKINPSVLHRKSGNPNYPFKRPVPKAHSTKIYFCDGNHEDHISLRESDTNEVYPNVFWMKAGSILTLEDGRTVLFLGGARSIDRDSRKINDNVNSYGWFPQEILQDHVVREIPHNLRVDIVISHTCPQEFSVFGDGLRDEDPSRICLSYVLQKFSPSLWYFGHWHTSQTGYDRGCRWTAMNRIDWSPGAWTVLPD